MEVLKRDGFRCVLCGATDKTLHVHHGYYESGLDLWEYETSTLWTLCAPCHVMVTDRMRDVWRELGMCHPGLLGDILLELEVIRGVFETLDSEIVTPSPNTPFPSTTSNLDIDTGCHTGVIEGHTVTGGVTG